MKNKKINLIFDATIISGGHYKNSRTGIYFVAYNLIKQFLNIENLNITFYCDSKFYGHVEEELNTLFPNKKFKFLSEIPIDSFVNKYIIYKNKKEEYKRKKEVSKKNKYKLLQYLCGIYINLKTILFKTNTKKLNNYDVFFSPCFKIPDFIEKKDNIKKFILLHDVIPLVLDEYKQASIEKSSWFKQLIDTINNKNYYITNSEYTKKDFKKYFPIINEQHIKSTLLACGESFINQPKENITEVKQKYNIPQDKKYLFSLCNIEPRKNLKIAVKAFIQFIKQNNIDDLVFVLGGAHFDDFINSLKSEIQNFKEVEDKIIKAGYVDDEDLAPLYSGAEWFVYTSKYEGFGLPPLEAMSCGSPVITSNNTSLPEVIGNAGIMIDYDSIEQHINAYKQYYFNKELRENNSKKGIERASQFSWEKCANEIISFIEDINNIKAQEKME